MRNPAPIELARYLIWSGKLCSRANARWCEVRPPDAPRHLIQRDALNQALLAALSDLGEPAPVNSKHAGRLVAAIFAERPDDVRREARLYLAHAYSTAIQGDC